MIAALAALLAVAAPEPAPARFALVVGADDGGPDRVRLRFAATDASAVADVLTALGGVPDDQLVRLLEPDRAAFARALEALGARIAAVRGASSVVVYYSGHSDAAGLLLGGERYPYADLRRDLDALPATVQVVVVDGCASGAMIRAKGGEAAPAFLASPSHAVTGRAYLMSSSADEVSQEADHLGAGYFTHASSPGCAAGRTSTATAGSRCGRPTSSPPTRRWRARCARGSARSTRRSTSSCCLLYTSPSPRDRTRSRMPSSA